jgi:uncharacterized protein (TIGR03067 family)
MRALLATGLFVLSLALVGGAASGTRAEDKKADEKKAASSLEGGYTIVSGEHGGKMIPEAEIKGSVVRFTGNQILGTDKDKKEFFSATYTLDTSKTPWVINMTSKQPKEEKTTGLIKKEGDTVTIIYALPGGEAPKEFKTKEKQNLFVLKSAGKGGKEPAKP